MDTCRRLLYGPLSVDAITGCSIMVPDLVVVKVRSTYASGTSQDRPYSPPSPESGWWRGKIFMQTEMKKAEDN